MSSAIPSKRTRLSELEQTHQQQNLQNLQQQNLQQFNQHSQLRQMYPSPNQHQHQLVPGEFIQSPQVQQQQKESESPLLTQQDIHRLGRGIDLLIDAIIPNKSQQAKEAATTIINSLSSLNCSDNLATQKNDSNFTQNSNSNSLVLDMPNLNEPTQNKSEKIASPLCQLLNHTYPNSIVELVNKLSKMSLNPLDLPVTSSLSSSTNITKSISNSLPKKVPSSIPANNPSKISPPSNELCQQLMQDYFNHFNTTIPILDRRKFIDHWRNKNTKHSQLLVASTLALAAARYSDDPSIQKTHDKPGGIFFDSAKKLLDTMYDKPRLETVQALLLLSHAESSLSRIDSSFMFLGMAVQMAHTLHLGRNESSNFIPEEDEERRRVFYCVYCCDRWISFIMGKPYSIDNININVQLPSLPSFDPPTRNFFISFIKLSHIIGEIWKFGYSSQPKAAQSNWIGHAMDQKSMLRQIRAALAKWLKELPDELQYQYLPNTDTKSLFQLARFSVHAGYINILFHTCIILLHQPYLTQAYDNPKIEANQGPIKTCLTAATTITDIAKTTRHFDNKAFCNFLFPIYGILQSAVMEMVIMNGSAEHAQSAKKSLNDTLEELRSAADNANYGSLQEIVKELECIMMIANGNTDNNTTPAANSLQPYHQLSSSYSGSNQHAHDISSQSGNSQWESFYNDDYMFDVNQGNVNNVNTSNTEVTAAPHHVIDDLSLYSTSPSLIHTSQTSHHHRLHDGNG
ncbi:556_t:CDS:2, partial [Funneliformis geosporum]